MAKGAKSPLQTWDDKPHPRTETLSQINEALGLAEVHHLQAEMIWSTINFILIKIEQGEKPKDVDIGQALEAGLVEWDI